MLPLCIVHVKRALDPPICARELEKDKREHQVNPPMPGKHAVFLEFPIFITPHGSRFPDHSSRFTNRGSRITVHGSRTTVEVPTVAGHGISVKIKSFIDHPVEAGVR